MTDTAAQAIFVAAARGLAHADGPGSSLQAIIGSIATHLDIESAVVVTVDDRPGRLEIAASVGLGDAALAGLTAAIGNPAHPIARTIVAATPSFDVLPIAPGGPALRSHLPLIVTRDGADVVLGVLALAHAHPTGHDTRLLLRAGADLAAVSIECRRRG
jgi:hypothetical protein